MAERREERSVLKGTIAKITYQDPERHYTVARLEVDGAEGVTVVGEIFPLDEGEEIRVRGLWRVHPCLLYTSPSPRD